MSDGRCHLNWRFLHVHHSDVLENGLKSDQNATFQLRGSVSPSQDHARSLARVVYA